MGRVYVVMLTCLPGGRPNVMKLVKEAYYAWGAEVVFITSNYQGNKEIMEGCKAEGIPAFVCLLPPHIRLFIFANYIVRTGYALGLLSQHGLLSQMTALRTLLPSINRNHTTTTLEVPGAHPLLSAARYLILLNL